MIYEKLGLERKDLSFSFLQTEEVKKKIGQMTFATATDGNHGRAVAWAARQMGQKAVVYLPKGSARQRVEAIKETGAEAIVTDLNYDETVQLVKQKAQQHDWQIVQDTAWSGYTQIPEWIMQGYTTMAAEAEEQLLAAGIDKPSHLFLQAGVGSMAGAVLGYFVNHWKGEHPITAIVEPHRAACIYQSVRIGDGKAHQVTGDLATIMAGLSCGEPNPVAWETLRDFADIYFSCDDSLSARGMRILANPLGDDPRIISGESGAVGIGILSALLQENRYEEIRKRLGLDEESVILLFSTEGETDPVSYRQIVWDGKYPY
jgi:diaminopropionate ammonia-lyase